MSRSLSSPAATTRFVADASPRYLARHGTPRSPDDLPDHVAVGYFSSRTGRELDWEYADMDSGEMHTVKMHSVVSVNSSQAYLACCLAGLGLIQAPRDGVVADVLVGDGQPVEFGEPLVLLEA